MTMQTSAEAVASKITYAGSATAFIGGMTANEFAAVGGLVVAVIALIINTAMSWHFKSQHLKLAREKAGRIEDSDD